MSVTEETAVPDQTPTGRCTGDGQPAAGEQSADLGYFGPDSVAWRVFLHPATQLMIAQITNVLETPHIEFQYVLAEHDPVFGARRRTRISPADAPVTFFDRIVRTVSVPAPMLFGSTAQADLAARQLFNYHRPMRGTMPESGAEYSAVSEDSMLFAAVTIAHAARLAYERYAYVDGRPPHRLPETERSRYLQETAELGVLMGVPRERFPVDSAALDAYYASVTDSFRTKPGWWRDRLRALRVLSRLGGGRRLRHLAVDLGLLLTEIVSLADVPRDFRRHNGIPAAADPLLYLGHRALRPVLRTVAGTRRGRAWVDRTYSRGDARTLALLVDARAARACSTSAPSIKGEPMTPTALPAAHYNFVAERDGELHADPDVLDQVFAGLDPVAVSRLAGRWRGREILSGHPLDRSLSRVGWYGKDFDGPDEVRPVLLSTAGGRVYAIDPGRLPTAVLLSPPALPGVVDRALRRGLDLLRPALATSRYTATLRTVGHGDQRTAAMVYDKQPIVDVFKSLDDDVVLGAMQYRGMHRPYYFLLQRT